MQNNTTQKEVLVNSTTDTLQKSSLRERTDRAWFSRLVRHPARKRSGSILTTPGARSPEENPVLDLSNFVHLLEITYDHVY